MIEQPRVALIDYGMGNLRSVEKALEFVGLNVVVTSDPDTVAEAGAVVLPGVGAFQDAMTKLTNAGLAAAISSVISSGKPFLGICLGLQLLFSEGEEGGTHKGLGIFPGTVRLLPPGPKIPHMGWNVAHASGTVPLLKGISSDSRFYFVHSYYVDPVDPTLIATTTEHGITFTSSIAAGNLFACQFHPEKSGAVGIHLLRNFADTIPTTAKRAG